MLLDCLYDESLNVGLIIVDSIAGLSDKSIAHSLPAKRLMEELQAVCVETGVAMLLVNHLNKGRSNEIRQRMAGATGLSLLCVKLSLAHKTAKTRKSMQCGLISLMPQVAVPGLAYQFNEGKIEFTTRVHRRKQD